MSENQKCLNLIRRGGGQQFSKILKLKSLKFPMGEGGGQAYLGIFPKFFRFFFMMAPLNDFDGPSRVCLTPPGDPKATDGHPCLPSPCGGGGVYG